MSALSSPQHSTLLRRCSSHRLISLPPRRVFVKNQTPRRTSVVLTLERYRQSSKFESLYFCTFSPTRSSLILAQRGGVAVFTVFLLYMDWISSHALSPRPAASAFLFTNTLVSERRTPVRGKKKVIGKRSLSILVLAILLLSHCKSARFFVSF